MSNTILSDQIEMLRVQLENALPIPLVLVVSSARAADGKSIVATALAQSMEGAGYSTLLVLADEATCGVTSKRELKSLLDVAEYGLSLYTASAPLGGVSRLPIPSNRMRQSVSRESVGRFIDSCRNSYAVTILETAGMLDNSFAALASGVANGVVLTIREGRRVCSADRQLAQLFERDAVPFLGVVSVAAAIIADGNAGASRQRVTAMKIPSVAADLAPSREEQTV